MKTKLTQTTEKAAKRLHGSSQGSLPSRPVSPPTFFARGAMKAGPACTTSRHNMAVWLPANIDDKDPWTVLA